MAVPSAAVRERLDRTASVPFARVQD